MPDDRLPTREQIANRPKPETRSTCVLCWQPKPETLENGVCAECRRGLDMRVTALVAENARLREALSDCIMHPIDSPENVKARIRARRLLDA